MKNIKISILTGPYFDELSVVSYLCHLRKRGIPSSLVGLTSDLPTGLHSLTIKPNLSLAEFLQLVSTSGNQHSVIIPGGYEGAEALLAKPRVHKVITAVFQSGNVVTAMLPAQKVLADMGTPSPDNVCHFLA